MKLMLNKSLNFVSLVCCCIALSGCVTQSKDVEQRAFQISSLVKTDIDSVAEMHQKVVLDSLAQLATKLYKRNPREWRKGGHESLESAVADITQFPFPEVDGKSSIDCIRLAFNDDYPGDRVRAFIVGLETMILNAYDGDREFFIPDLLDPQKLYDSARNIELASWLIRTKKNAYGELFLLSSGETEPVVNSSFPRLYGKMINAQDMLALIVADTSNRQIKLVLQSVAAAFIPI